MNFRKLIRIYIAVLCLLFCLYGFVGSNYTEEMNNLAAWLLIFISAYLVILNRKNIVLFVIYFFIFYANYSIAINKYLVVSSDSFLNQISDVQIKGIGIYTLLFFTLILLILHKDYLQTTKIDRLSNTYLARDDKNQIIGFLMLFFVCSIFIGTVLLEVLSGQVYEYAIIFFIFGFYYGGNNRIIKNTLFIVLLLYVFYTFFSGDRVSVLQFLVAYYLMFYGYKSNYFKILPGLIIGILLLSFLGIYGDGLSTLSIANTVSVLKARAFALDTSYYAYHTSLTFIMVKEIVGSNEQFRLLLKFILSIFLGGRVTDSNLAIYTRSYYLHYNGGLLPMFFYFWLGWLGIVVPSILVNAYSKLVSSIRYNSSGLRKCLAIYFASTVFRWYLYSPIALLRGVLLLIISYYSLIALKKLFLRFQNGGESYARNNG